jgi:hypothetical protein
VLRPLLRCVVVVVAPRQVLRVLRPLLRRVVVVAPRQVLCVLRPLLRRVVVESSSSPGAARAPSPPPPRRRRRRPAPGAARAPSPPPPPRRRTKRRTGSCGSGSRCTPWRARRALHEWAAVWKRRVRPSEALCCHQGRRRRTSRSWSRLASTIFGRQSIKLSLKNRTGHEPEPESAQ